MGRSNVFFRMFTVTNFVLHPSFLFPFTSYLFSLCHLKYFVEKINLYSVHGIFYNTTDV